MDAGVEGLLRGESGPVVDPLGPLRCAPRRRSASEQPRNAGIAGAPSTISSLERNPTVLGSSRSASAERRVPRRCIRKQGHVGLDECRLRRTRIDLDSHFETKPVGRRDDVSSLDGVTAAPLREHGPQSVQLSSTGLPVHAESRSRPAIVPCFRAATSVAVHARPLRASSSAVDPSPRDPSIQTTSWSGGALTNEATISSPYCRQERNSRSQASWLRRCRSAESSARRSRPSSIAAPSLAGTVRQPPPTAISAIEPWSEQRQGFPCQRLSAMGRP